MAFLSLAALTSYARRSTLTQSELDLIFGCYTTPIAPMFKDPNPSSPVPYAHRLADHTYPDRPPTTQVVVTDDDGDEDGPERIIKIVVAEDNVVLYSQVICMHPNGRLANLTLCGPVVNISVDYTDNLLTGLTIFASGKYIRKQFVAGALDQLFILLEQSGQIVGVARTTSSSVVTMITADCIDKFAPTIIVTPDAAASA